MPLSAGTRLGPYEIMSLIGVGGMGEVYRARDTKLNRDVAIKVLPQALTNDAERLARFRREAQLLAALNHPNIAHIHGFEDSTGVPALVMELVEGPTLAERIARGPIPIDEALPLATQIAEALAAAHAQGIIHRDLKPANIKVRDDGAVKVLDFGLAKALEPSDASRLGSAAAGLTQSPTITTPAMMTGVGVILGTAAYMSPEQAKGRPTDKRSDVWAFGCVLYEMITGMRAFGGEDISDTLATILKGAPDWTALPANTPATISKLLRRCLAKDAGERIHDIADARLDVRDALAGLGDEDVVAAIPGRSREPIAWVLFSAALAAAIGLATVASFQRSPLDTLTYRASLPLPSNVTLAGSSANRFSLSPDGRRLAFVAAGQGARPMLWVRSLDGLIAQPLSGTEDADAPFWSPDSRFIGFFAAGKIKKIDAAGGPSLTVCEYPARSAAVGATWSRDDVILFSSGGGQAGVQRVAASGGTPVQATTPDQQAGELGHVRPSFLPDGRHFLYMALGGRGPGTTGGFRLQGVYVASLLSQERKPLVQDGRNPSYAQGYVVFLRGSTLMAQALDVGRLEMKGAATPIAEQVQDGGGTGLGLNGAFAISETGALVYQAGSSGGTRRLVWFDRSGKQVGVLGDLGEYRDVEVSPDQTRAAISVVDAATQTPNIWLFDVARGVPSRLTFDTAGDLEPIWSPDSSRIVFASRRGGRQDLYTKAASGASGDEAPLTDGGGKAPTSWSPDGRFILYSQRPAGGRGRGIPPVDQAPGTLPSVELWVLPLFGDRRPFPFQQKPFSGDAGRFSPDGRWVAYSSNESGRAEVYVTPFPGPGGKWRVSTAGGVEPTWRHDGREIFYLAPDGKLMAATVNGRGSTFEIGSAQSLFETSLRLQVGTNPTFYDASADGERFLLNILVDDPRAAPMTLVVNWPAGLKK
jgi:serine/threonine protein kinase